ncbi:MAG: 3-deoxy-D-manno-octulosonic acid transferase [Planctomycetes bacterium]|nr:3-deoxy-D-manno-octulosonic acid transferase [Planctomycetota bacterium]
MTSPSLLRGWLTMCVYQPLLFLAFVAYGPVLLWRSLWDRRFRRGLRERMGGVPRLETDRGVVWIHGVSVGEVKAARNFIALLRERRPDLQLVISSTTPNGHQVARQEHPDLPVIYYPLDLGPFPGRALRRIRPRCVLLMELEIWPNFLQVAHRRGIPIAIINGRISERTFHGYRLARGLLPQLDLIRAYCVQDRSYQQRLLDLGVDAERVHVTGNMKYDSVVMGEQADPQAPLRRWLAPNGELVLVAGSTHADEELWVLEAARIAAAAAGTRLRVVLVPRHPERAVAVCDQLEGAGARSVRWSTAAELPPLAPDAVVVVDVIGQLQKFYAASDLAFVGGSLVPHGGQNMLEPAALGVATLFGPHTTNFRRDVEVLLAADGAIEVPDRDALATALTALCRSVERRAELGRNAHAVIRDNQGATARTLELVGGLLG